jgi:two-component system nitrate/nitrite response regulator NarL
VDDHRLFADAVRPTLEELAMDVSTATSGAEAIEAVTAEPYDLVLLDLGLPDEGGVSVGRKILEARPHTVLVAVTAIDDPRAVKEALDAGFRGYVTKDVRIQRFVAAIRAALEGEVVVPRRTATAVTGTRSAEERHAELLARQLTRREEEVLALLVEGARGEEIGRRLSISSHTVRTHVQSILTKLQVHSRLEAATFAVRHGIVSPPNREGTARRHRRPPASASG